MMKQVILPVYKDLVGWGIGDLGYHCSVGLARIWPCLDHRNDNKYPAGFELVISDSQLDPESVAMECHLEYSYQYRVEWPYIMTGVIADGHEASNNPVRQAIEDVCTQMGWVIPTYDGAPTKLSFWATLYYA
jgi:hypothetical protein